MKKGNQTNFLENSVQSEPTKPVQSEPTKPVDPMDHKIYLLLDKDLLVHYLEDGLIYPNRYFQELHPHNTEIISGLEKKISNALYITNKLELRSDEYLIAEIELPKKISGIDIPGPYQGVLPITIIHIIYSFDKTSQTILERIINTSDISHRDNLILKTLENTEIKEQRSLPVPQTRVNNKLKSNIFKFMKILGGISYLQNTEYLMRQKTDVTSSLDTIYRRILFDYAGVEFEEDFIKKVSDSYEEIPLVI